MPKFFVALFVVILASARLAAHSAAEAAPTGGLRYTVAVTRFENHAKYMGPFALADCWGAVLTDSLQRSGRFIVLGESDLRQAALAEQDFAKNGRAVAGSKAPVFGVMTPAQLLVKGEITHFQDGTQSNSGTVGFGGFNVGVTGSTAEVNALVMIVDASTGQVVASKKVVGKAKSSGLTLGMTKSQWNGDLSQLKATNVGKALETAIDEAVAFCTAQIPNLRWSGEVIMVKDGHVYINRGQREGVAVGERFKVGIAEPLRDPGTGELLEVNFTELGQIRVDDVRDKIAVCSIVNGAGIEKGMSVSLP